MRINVLSRSSALARLQAALVSRALSHGHPDLLVECHTRASAGDRDQASPLWQMGGRGAFTADLSHALLHGEADVVVHSFKDLPIELPPRSGLSGLATAWHLADHGFAVRVSDSAPAPAA